MGIHNYCSLSKPFRSPILVVWSARYEESELFVYSFICFIEVQLLIGASFWWIDGSPVDVARRQVVGLTSLRLASHRVTLRRQGPRCSRFSFDSFWKCFALIFIQRFLRLYFIYIFSFLIFRDFRNIFKDALHVPHACGCASICASCCCCCCWCCCRCLGEMSSS